MALAIVEALRLVCLTAFSNGTGRVQGIVAGEAFRRGVARTLAQQIAAMFEEAYMPFQYALSTRAGTDCVARAARALTDFEGRKTFIYINGVGAIDTSGGPQCAAGVGADRGDNFGAEVWVGNGISLKQDLVVLSAVVHHKDFIQHGSTI